MRRSRRMLVEDVLVFDLAPITRSIRASCSQAALATLTVGGQRVATVDVDLSEGVLEIRYPLRHSLPDRAPMVTTPQPFGGVRWWMCCPRCNRRCGKLYRPAYPAAALACRHCHQLDYECQRVSLGERWRLRASRLYARLGTDADATFHRKPKWMRWGTFDRRLQQAHDFQEAGEAYSLRRVSRFLSHHS